MKRDKSQCAAARGAFQEQQMPVVRRVRARCPELLWTLLTLGLVTQTHCHHMNTYRHVLMRQRCCTKVAHALKDISQHGSWPAPCFGVEIERNRRGSPSNVPILMWGPFYPERLCGAGATVCSASSAKRSKNGKCLQCGAEVFTRPYGTCGSVSSHHRTRRFCFHFSASVWRMVPVDGGLRSRTWGDINRKCDVQAVTWCPFTCCSSGWWGKRESGVAVLL